MLDAIAETAAAKNQSKSDSSRQKLAEDLDQFMTLLVTQLKYQDPLDPMDPNEFTSQLVQFASVEQQIHGNANLEQMLDLQKTSLLATVVGYIGAEIDVTGDQMPLLSGKAQADYTLSEDSEDTTITVTDSNDRVVYFTKGEITEGKHVFQWDGNDNFGFPQDAGIYKFTASALDANGDPIDIAHGVTGTVTSVSMDNGSAIISMGGAEYKMDDVLAIRQAN